MGVCNQFHFMFNHKRIDMTRCNKCVFCEHHILSMSKTGRVLKKIYFCKRFPPVFVGIRKEFEGMDRSRDREWEHPVVSETTSCDEGAPTLKAWRKRFLSEKGTIRRYDYDPKEKFWVITISE